jgi:hypothetical protein
MGKILQQEVGLANGSAGYERAPTLVVMSIFLNYLEVERAAEIRLPKGHLLTKWLERPA